MTATNGIVKKILEDHTIGPWVFRLLLLCGILWTQLTYVPRSTFDRFQEGVLKEQEHRIEVLSDIKEKVARIEERQRIRMEREGKP